jgi:hypothetical protein
MNFKEIVNEVFEENLKDGFINEAGDRQFVPSNNLYDVMSEMKGDVRVCVGYMSVAKLNLPQVRRINPATKREKKYDDYETFGRELNVEGNIVGVIKLSKYHRFNYVTPDDVSKRYAEFRDNKDAIKVRYGLNPTNRESKSGKYSTKQEYGSNGIDSYSGDNEEKKGNTYMPQNVHGAIVSSAYCLINDKGNIVKTFKKEDLTKYLKPYKDPDVEALRKLGKDEEEIKRFLDEVGTLKMKYQKFETSKILYIAGKSNDPTVGKFTYINTNLQNVIDGVPINPSEFIKIATKQYKIDIDNLD